VSAATEREPEQRLLLFALGEEHYAIALERTQQVFPLSTITPVPGAPAHILGVVNLQGRLLAILDVAGFLGLPPATEAGFVVVLRHQPPELGLLVQRIADIVAIGSAAYVPLSATQEHPPALIAQVRLEQGLVGVLDVDLLIQEVTA
jgi:purine-binding chemotaxis protein CheW